MFDSKRNVYAPMSPVIVMSIMTLLFAACQPVFIPIPVSTSGTPIVIVIATPRAAPVELATPHPPDAPVEAEVVTESETGETADSAGLAPVADGPASISHKFVGREACLDCHEVGDSKHAAPPDHEAYGNDLCLYCHAPQEDDVTLPQLPEEASEEFCLGCHGPYAALMERTADKLTDEDGVTGNPHMYVPHESTTITSCKYCHEVHALPAVPAEIPQADAGYCFAACHHEQNFEPCSDCHE